MFEMQRFFADDHIQGLEREAAALRAERARDREAHRPPETPASAGLGGPETDDVTGHALDAAAVAGAPVPVMPTTMNASDAVGASGSADHVGSPRIRLGRWLVGVGTAIAGPELDSTLVSRLPAAAAAGTVAAAGTACTGPCGDDHSSLSHAA
jgi:hypothetical protein